MAKEEIKPTDEIKVKSEKTFHKVKKEFTLDKLYGVGSVIELSEGKLKTKLLTNKFI